MIDWIAVVSNAIWICGCALALATVSYAHWEANARRERLRANLRRPRQRIAIGLAGALVCLGLAATSRSTVEFIVWLALTAAFLIQVFRQWRSIRHSAEPAASRRPGIQA